MNNQVSKGSVEPQNTHPDNDVESNVAPYLFQFAFVHFMQQLKIMYDWFDCEYGIKNPCGERSNSFKEAYDGIFSRFNVSITFQ